MTGDINQYDSFGRNAAHYAVGNKNIAALEHLCQDGVEIDVDKQTIGGLTPLILAVKGGDVKVVAAVLNCNGNPFFRDQLGMEPSDMATYNEEMMALID